MVSEIFYLRFGKVPEDESSRVYWGDTGVIGKEDGVSAWYAVKINDRYHMVAPNPTTSSSYSDFCHSAFPRETGECGNEPIYILRGKCVGYGMASEPLLKDIEIIEELPSDYFLEKNQEAENKLDNMLDQWLTKYNSDKLVMK